MRTGRGQVRTNEDRRERGEDGARTGEDGMMTGEDRRGQMRTAGRRPACGTGVLPS